MIKVINKAHYRAICDFCQEMYDVGGQMGAIMVIDILSRAGWRVFIERGESEKSLLTHRCVCHKHEMYEGR